MMMNSKLPVELALENLMLENLQLYFKKLILILMMEAKAIMLKEMKDLHLVDLGL